MMRTTAQQPQQAAALRQVETVEETPVEDTIAQAAVEDANARRVDPNVLEAEDDRFDVANDLELYNSDDIAEYNGDRHARKWTNYELKKGTLIDDEVSVGVGACARKITWKVRFNIKKSDVDPVSSEEFPDVDVCDFDFSAQNGTMKTTANPKKKKYKKQKKQRINLLSLLIHLWPGRWEDQLERMNNRVEAYN